MRRLTLSVIICCLVLITHRPGNTTEESFQYAIVSLSSVLVSNPYYSDYLLTDMYINSAIPPEIKAIYERNFFVSLLNYRNQKLYLIPGSFSNWLSKDVLLIYSELNDYQFFVYFFSPEKKTLQLKQKIKIPFACPLTVPLNEHTFLVQKKELDNKYSLCKYDLISDNLNKIYTFESAKLIRLIPQTNKLLCLEKTDETLSKLLVLNLDDLTTRTFVLNLPNLDFAGVYSTQEIYVSSTDKNKQTSLYKISISEMDITPTLIDSYISTGEYISIDDKYLYLTKIDGTSSRLMKYNKQTGDKETLPVALNSHNPRRFGEKNTLLYFLSPYNIKEKPRLSKSSDVLYELPQNGSERKFKFSEIIWLPIEGGNIE